MESVRIGAGWKWMEMEETHTLVHQISNDIGLGLVSNSARSQFNVTSRLVTHEDGGGNLRAYTPYRLSHLSDAKLVRAIIVFAQGPIPKPLCASRFAPISPRRARSLSLSLSHL